MLTKPDKKVYSRLMRVMMAIANTDESHPRGLRTVWDGDLQLLRKFEFNQRSEVEGVFYGTFTPSINRTTGILKVDIPVFDPKKMVVAPDGCTHFRFVVGGVELDLADETFVRDVAYSAYVPWVKDDIAAPISISCNLTPDSTLPLYLVFGIEYVFEENSAKYPMMGGRFNAVRIAQVEA